MDLQALQEAERIKREEMQRKKEEEQRLEQEQKRMAAEEAERIANTQLPVRLDLLMENAEGRTEGLTFVKSVGDTIIVIVITTSTSTSTTTTTITFITTTSGNCAHAEASRCSRWRS
jgi:hypothetical protein